MNEENGEILGGGTPVEESSKKIYITKDYSIFKKLTGNRSTELERITKICDSIREVGYITSPILVNENMEVIDGQGRLEAFKELGIPVEYIIETASLAYVGISSASLYFLSSFSMRFAAGRARSDFCRICSGLRSSLRWPLA